MGDKDKGANVGKEKVVASLEKAIVRASKDLQKGRRGITADGLALGRPNRRTPIDWFLTPDTWKLCSYHSKMAHVRAFCV